MIALARGAKPFHHLITNLFTPDRLPGPFKRHRKRKKTIYFKKLQVQRYRFEIYFFPRDNESMEHWFILKNNVLAVQKRPQNFDHIDVGDK